MAEQAHGVCRYVCDATEPCSAAVLFAQVSADLAKYGNGAIGAHPSRQRSGRQYRSRN